MSDNTKKPFDAKVSKLLKLMIHSVYTNRDIFLRELISNASDAIEKRKYLSLSDNSMAVENGEYKITIKVNKKEGTISVRDLGIGMNEEELINNLGVIAQSGTEEFIEKSGTASSELIGQFGIGFYSIFMIAKRAEVKTRKINENKVYKWESDGESGYTIKEIDHDFEYGTEVKLYINDDEDSQKYLDKYHIKHVMEVYSNNVSAPLFLIDSEDDGKVDKVTGGGAIWHKDKKDITEEDYKNFYKSISHLPDSPSLTMHYKAEGKTEYSALLFVPSMKPFDLFHPDRQTRVKLYVKKVFICETGVDIIPKYLRFIYGVIDSADLPLNINRETLQDSAILAKITDSVTKKIISELKNKSKKDPEEYDKIWDKFGAVIKEGLCERMSDRDSVFAISKFFTTKSQDKPVFIEEYISRMKENQKDIFFCLADSVSEAIQNPQLEAFIANDIEVLLLTDAVDGFWINVVNDYQGKDIKSVNRSDIDIKDISKKDDKEKDLDQKSSEDDEDGKIIKYFKEALSDLVKDIRVSTKLTDSPACIAIDPGFMEIKMEKFMVEQNQMKSGTLKVLELNKHNKLVKSTLKKLENDKSEVKESGFEMAKIIFEMACLSQGEPIKNPALLCKKIYKIMENDDKISE